MEDLGKIVEELIYLGFIGPDYKDKGEEAVYRSMLGKISPGSQGLAYRQEAFLGLALDLLGYRGDQVLTRGRDLGFRIASGPYSQESFFQDFYQLLGARTQEGRDFFGLLCLEGVFKDFNKDRQPPELLYFKGRTQPIFDCGEAILERVYVESPLDTDQDGKRDLIASYIKRPRETERGLKLATIYIASPYMMGGDEDKYRLHKVDREMPVYETTNIAYGDLEFHPGEDLLPEARTPRGQARAEVLEDMEFQGIGPWYNYFLARGYALVFAGGIGTRGSEGIRTCGSREETLSTIAVIDWLNARVNAFTNREDNIQTQAFWSTGKVAMTGKSYLGTLAIAAATTGVEGLETIIPEAAISNWYDYYRSGGLLSAGLDWQGDDADLLASFCFSRALDQEEDQEALEVFLRKKEELLREADRISGNYNRFWDERNYLKDVKNIRASVFIVHGLRDFNVKPQHFHQFWQELDKYPLEKKMLLHQGDHIYFNDHYNFPFGELMNQWLDHYLYGYENNIYEDLPPVIIQNNLDPDRFDSSRTWPAQGSQEEDYFVHQGVLGQEKSQEGSLVGLNNNTWAAGFRGPGDEASWRENLLASQGEREYRLVYLTGELEEGLRISGRAQLSLRASLDQQRGILSAMLVDYGDRERFSLDLEEVGRELDLGINGGSLAYKRFKREPLSSYRIITRGSINVQNRRNNYNKDGLIIGEAYDFKIGMEAMDYSLARGHRLGLIIYSTDVEMTERPLTRTNFTLDEASIHLSLPQIKPKKKKTT